MADKKQNGLIVIKVFKRAKEKQSESLSQPCIITVYGDLEKLKLNINNAFNLFAAFLISPWNLGYTWDILQ